MASGGNSPSTSQTDLVDRLVVISAGMEMAVGDGLPADQVSDTRDVVLAGERRPEVKLYVHCTGQ